MKIWTSERSNNVHTQRNPLEQCAILHHAPRTTLASLFFGRYACLLGFLRPLIFRRGLLATSWRRTFGLPLPRCGATGSGCSTLWPIGAFIFFDRWTALDLIYKIYIFVHTFSLCFWVVLHGFFPLWIPTFAPLRPKKTANTQYNYFL